MFYYGMFVEFELLQQVDKNFMFYCVVLVFYMWCLLFNCILDVYFGSCKMLDLIKFVFDMDKMLKYDIKVIVIYYVCDFVCQYMEIYVDFFLCWMECDGFYYYFMYDDKVDMIIILDVKEGYVVDMVMVEYCFVDKFDMGVGNRLVQVFIGNQWFLLKMVIVYDYDYVNVKVLFKFEYDVFMFNSVVGEIMLQGEYICSDEEGKCYVVLCVQELVCNGKQFVGEFIVVGLCSGYFMEMCGYYCDVFNVKYLVIEIEYCGFQVGVLFNGLDIFYNCDKSVVLIYYVNSFYVIVVEV